MPAEAAGAGGPAAWPAATEAERARRQALRIAVAAGSVMPFLAAPRSSSSRAAGR